MNPHSISAHQHQNLQNPHILSNPLSKPQIMMKDQQKKGLLQQLQLRSSSTDQSDQQYTPLGRQQHRITSSGLGHKKQHTSDIYGRNILNKTPVIQLQNIMSQSPTLETMQHLPSENAVRSPTTFGHSHHNAYIGYLQSQTQSHNEPNIQMGHSAKVQKMAPSHQNQLHTEESIDEISQGISGKNINPINIGALLSQQPPQAVSSARLKQLKKQSHLKQGTLTQTQLRPETIALSDSEFKGQTNNVFPESPVIPNQGRFQAKPNISKSQFNIAKQPDIAKEKSSLNTIGFQRKLTRVQTTSGTLHKSNQHNVSIGCGNSPSAFNKSTSNMHSKPANSGFQAALNKIQIKREEDIKKGNEYTMHNKIATQKPVSDQFKGRNLSSDKQQQPLSSIIPNEAYLNRGNVTSRAQIQTSQPADGDYSPQGQHLPSYKIRPTLSQSPPAHLNPVITSYNILSTYNRQPPPSIASQIRVKVPRGANFQDVQELVNLAGRSHQRLKTEERKNENVEGLRVPSQSSIDRTLNIGGPQYQRHNLIQQQTNDSLIRKGTGSSLRRQSQGSNTSGIIGQQSKGSISALNLHDSESIERSANQTATQRSIRIYKNAVKHIGQQTAKTQRKPQGDGSVMNQIVGINRSGSQLVFNPSTAVLSIPNIVNDYSHQRQMQFNQTQVMQRTQQHTKGQIQPNYSWNKAIKTSSIEMKPKLDINENSSHIQFFNYQPQLNEQKSLYLHSKDYNIPNNQELYIAFKQSKFVQKLSLRSSFKKWRFLTKQIIYNERRFSLANNLSFGIIQGQQRGSSKLANEMIRLHHQTLKTLQPLQAVNCLQGCFSQSEHSQVVSMLTHCVKQINEILGKSQLLIQTGNTFEAFLGSIIASTLNNLQKKIISSPKEQKARFVITLTLQNDQLTLYPSQNETQATLCKFVDNIEQVFSKSEDSFRQIIQRLGGLRELESFQSDAIKKTLCTELQEIEGFLNEVKESKIQEVLAFYNNPICNTRNEPIQNNQVISFEEKEDLLTQQTVLWTRMTDYLKLIDQHLPADQSFSNLSFVTLDWSELRSHLLQHISKVLLFIEARVIEKLQMDTDTLRKELNSALTTLLTVNPQVAPQTGHMLVKQLSGTTIFSSSSANSMMQNQHLSLNLYIEQLNTVKVLNTTMLDHLSERHSQVKSLSGFLQTATQRQNDPLIQMIQANITDIERSLHKLPKAIVDCKEHLLVQKPLIEAKLKQSCVSLSTKIKAFEKKYQERYIDQWESNASNQDETGLEQLIEEISKRELIIEEIKVKANQLKECISIIGFEEQFSKFKDITCFEDLDKLEQLHSVNIKIWKALLDVKKNQSSIQATPFLKLSMSDVHDQLKVMKDGLAFVNDCTSSLQSFKEFILQEMHALNFQIGLVSDLQRKASHYCSSHLDHQSIYSNILLKKKHWQLLFQLTTNPTNKQNILLQPTSQSRIPIQLCSPPQFKEDFTISDLNSGGITSTNPEIQAIIKLAEKEERCWNAIDQVKALINNENCLPLKLVRMPSKIEGCEIMLISEFDITKSILEEKAIILKNFRKDPQLTDLIIQDEIRLIEKDIEALIEQI